MNIIKKIVVIIELIIILGVLTFITKASSKDSLFCIYLDPGHGGFDGGTTCNNKEIIEKDLTLEVSLTLASRLRSSGYIVKLTREKDEALNSSKKEDIYKRVDLINKSNANLYISIHANSYPNTVVHGAQVFYNHTNNQNKLLAESIMKNLKIIDKTNKRQIHVISDKYLTDHVVIPGCLVEIGFLSNPYDLANLRDKTYLNNLCEMIYLGIVEYLDYIK